MEKENDVLVTKSIRNRLIGVPMVLYRIIRKPRSRKRGTWYIIFNKNGTLSAHLTKEDSLTLDGDKCTYLLNSSSVISNNRNRFIFFRKDYAQPISPYNLSPREEGFKANEVWGLIEGMMFKRWVTAMNKDAITEGLQKVLTYIILAIILIIAGDVLGYMNFETLEIFKTLLQDSVEIVAK